MVRAWFSAGRRGRKIARGAAATVILAAALAITGCGSAGSSDASTAQPAAGSPAASASGSGVLTGTESAALLASAATDTEMAPSVQIKTDGLTEGTDSQPISFDLTVVQNVGCQGTVGESKTQTFQLVFKGSQIWIKPSNGYYADMHLTPAELSLVAGKWIKISSTDSQAAGFHQLCNLSALFASASPAETGLVATLASYQGKSAYKIVDKVEAGYAYVSDSATPMLLELVESDKSNAVGMVSFSTSNTPQPITAPPSAETIDGSQVGI